MRRVLTHPPSWLWQSALSALLCSAGVAWASADNPKANEQGIGPVPLLSIAIESRREGDSRMTWKIQKVVYADGLTILALAGLQFEEALGLSVVLIDPPPVALFGNESVPESKTTPTSIQRNETDAQKVGNISRSDIAGISEKRLPGEPARAEIQIKNVLFDLNDLNQKDSQALATVPDCDRGRRRAIVFIRPKQTARTFNLDFKRASELSQYGRAACLRWDGFPPEVEGAARSSSQTSVPSL